MDPRRSWTVVSIMLYGFITQNMIENNIKCEFPYIVE